MHLHLDAIGGIAGDMFVACVTDAFPDLRPGLLEAVRKAGLPGEIDCGFDSHDDGVLTGSRFRVDIPQRLVGAVAQHHTPFAEIRQRIAGADLDAAVKDRAVDIFRRLAEVEAAIHGTTVDEVGFHELGGWDSVADMVGAAWLIVQLGVTRCTVSKLPLGSGRVKTSHGPLPVPVPAVARLLTGYEFIDDGIGGERITPTGAAILRHLDARQDGRRAGRLGRTGYGFGTRRLAGISNVLRAMSLEQALFDGDDGDDGDDGHDGHDGDDRVARISFDVDDQSPEDLAIGLERVRATAGVIDVLQSVAYGKKGRLCIQVQVLAEAAALETVCDVCLRETTTLGVRHEIVRRRTLRRHHATVTAQGRAVRVKLAERPQGQLTAKAESDDLRAAQGDRAERAALRDAAQAQALKKVLS